MKKVLCLILVLILTLGVMAGCGKEKAQETPDTNEAAVAEIPVTETPDANEAPSDETTVTEAPEDNSEAQPKKTPAKDSNSTQTPAPSTNEEVIKEDADAPEVYIITKGGNNAESISYHLKDCPLLSGKEYQMMGWEMVRTLGFRQCPSCNPPRYEGYIE